MIDDSSIQPLTPTPVSAAVPMPGFGVAWPGMSQPDPNALSGNWTVRESGTIGSCRILLRPIQGHDYGDAASFGCFGALFNTSRWAVQGNTITLYNLTREPIATLWITAPNRMEGGSYILSR